MVEQQFKQRIRSFGKQEMTKTIFSLKKYNMCYRVMCLFWDEIRRNKNGVFCKIKGVDLIEE